MTGRLLPGQWLQTGDAFAKHANSLLNSDSDVAGADALTHRCDHERRSEPLRSRWRSARQPGRAATLAAAASFYDDLEWTARHRGVIILGVACLQAIEYGLDRAGVVAWTEDRSRTDGAPAIRP
jgi:hypothetical protein